mmetsp:Transcript_40415/g.87477  ORF Transcript_40415/g.87477 Transcript_40415/m.87477 type:complete len:108 (+) Transcript_40415:24-347(+)
MHRVAWILGVLLLVLVVLEAVNIPRATKKDGDATTPCGGPSKVLCGAGQYCNAKSCDAPGTCAKRPEMCPMNFEPHCGCDGKTYSNKCAAASAGATVARKGPCESDL